MSEVPLYGLANRRAYELLYVGAYEAAGPLRNAPPPAVAGARAWFPPEDSLPDLRAHH